MEYRDCRRENRDATGDTCQAELEELRMARNEVSSLHNRIAVLKASIIANKAFLVGSSNVRYC